MTQTPIPTDHIKLTRELRRRLENALESTDDGCLLYPQLTIEVELYGQRGSISVSVQRVAWALAHPESSLGVEDFAVHVCERGRVTGAKAICCNPDHLRKGSREDAALMRKARVRRLVLQSEERCQ